MWKNVQDSLVNEKKNHKQSSIISSFIIFQEILYKNNKYYMPGTLSALQILTHLMLITTPLG